MARLKQRVTASAVTVVLVLVAATLGQVGGDAAAQGAAVRAALPPGSINNVLVIDLENESFSSTFGPTSPATYLNQTLVPEGELLDNYYATGHVSLDNYIAQISGQAPTPMTDSDCLSISGAGLVGQYVNVTPGTDDPNSSTYPGQVDGNGCVFPAPTTTTNGAPTIADQLDAAYPPDPVTHVASWREYAEDMGNDPTRDGGTPDPLGGTDCAHPTLGGTDSTETAEATDQYTTRHNPFMFFHSIIDNSAECDANVVPQGTVTVGTPSTFNGTPLPDTFTGHLANDLSSTATTPKFGFITPNLCDDGHDATCAGTNVEGGKTGGLVAADLWLKHWMPLILASPAYESGQMLVDVTFDEGGLTDTTACCNEQPGPNWAYPGFSPLLGTPPTTPGADPGGGRTGALLLNSKYIQPGAVDTTGSYNHYSALRSFEDLLGLTSGGADDLGHLGFAAASGLTPFGQDIFQPAVAPTITTDPLSQAVSSGNTLTFSAGASIETPTVQWQVSVDGGSTWINAPSTWINVPGATTSSLTTDPLTASENGWEVRAVFTNYVGTAITTAATITVNNPPPTTSVLIPSNGATLSGSTALDASASNATSVEFRLFGGSYGYNAPVLCTATLTYFGWVCSWNTTTVPNGSYVLVSEAFNSTGTAFSSGVNITVNNPPTTSVLIPSTGATLTGSTFLDASASNATSVEFRLFGGTYGYAAPVICTATLTLYGWLCYWNTTTVPNGSYVLLSEAFNSTGSAFSLGGATITVNNHRQ
jgi:hypothetical protein